MIPKKQSYLTSEKQVQKKTPRRNTSKLVVFSWTIYEGLELHTENPGLQLHQSYFFIKLLAFDWGFYHLK
jgi:hypothetical protein